jgi:hypothetical protein
VKFAHVFLLLCVYTTGCVSTGRASHAGFDWSGEVFPANPVSVVPYFTGVVLGAIAGSPLLLISWPATAIGYPEDGDEEDEIWSTLSPVGFTGTGFGTLLGGLFYPFGMPFMDAEEDEDGWDDEDNWEEDDNFDDGPPGGDEDPVPVPWTEDGGSVPKEDGAAVAPYRRAPLSGWEDYRPWR